MAAGRPLKFQSVEQLEEMIDGYFEDCKQRDEQPFITELAVWLDCDTDTLRNYEDRDEFFGTIKRAKQRCEMAVEKGMMTNKFNATASIFNLKNNYGWKDKTETDVTSQGQQLGVVVLPPKNNVNTVETTTETGNSPE